ncbi:MAG: lamin tail domain-containing protein [Candidatus Methanomethylophilaceae archaeon]|nr:lamin tail domain-containing protein [Candidatus Methanomethylophilaceae archaeon]
MRVLLLLVLAVLLAVYLSPVVSADSQEFKISAFDPVKEAVAIMNVGKAEADLKGYSIYDGEGSWEFKESLRIPAGGVLAFSSDQKCDAFDGKFPFVAVGENGLRKGEGSLILNNNGDQIYLMKSGKAVDAVCYGNKSISDGSLWTGPPADVRRGYYTSRTGGDTDTADDWQLCRPGVTGFRFDPDGGYGAEVTPFLFPDSGGAPIYNVLSSAKEKVEICLYHLGSRNVVSLLCDLEERGVDVVLLLEAEPLGIDLIEYVPMLASLVACGGEVLLIGGGDGRYSYVHAKYAIIDGETTIVTSENWTVDNMNGAPRQCSYDDDVGNRGWGVIVRSREMALFAEQVFRNDCDTRYGDVRALLEEYPNPRPYVKPRYVQPSEGSWEGYSARVVPFLSPDNSLDAEKYYMGASSYRVYSQQQSLGSSYKDLPDGSPLAVMAEAAERGADVRLILGGDTGPFCDSLCASTRIKAASMSFPYVHNKGLVCDGCALVSSVNWTENAFERNRELGVAVVSEEVSRYFSEAFLRDYSRYYLYEGFEVSFVEADGVYVAGEDAVVSVSVSAVGDYSFLWNLGDGRTRETSVPRMAFRPSQGDYDLTVTVTDGQGESKTAGFGYHAIPKGPEGASDLSHWHLIAIGVVATMAVLVALIIHRRRHGRNRLLGPRRFRGHEDHEQDSHASGHSRDGRRRPFGRSFHGLRGRRFHPGLDNG